MNNLFLFKRAIRILVIVLVILPIISSAQSSEVGIRFNNPSYDCDERTYCLDIEYQSNVSGDILYGTNVRFFYNSTELAFVDFRNLIQGYDVSVDPTPQTGQASSGADLFGFDANEAATWINGAIELKDLSNGKVIGNNQWTKYYQACFTVVDNSADISDFCPTLVWDLEQDASKGGFFQGDNGVVITVIDDDNKSNPTTEVVTHFNWTYAGDGSAPYGVPQISTEGCFTSECVCNIVAPTIIKSP